MRFIVILLITALFTTYSRANESCHHLISIEISKNTALQVTYSGSRPIESIRLNSHPLAIDSFSALNKTQLTKKEEFVVLTASKQTDPLSVQLSPLGKYINGVYAPYIRVNDLHGLHLAAVLPNAIKFDTEGPWQEVNAQCVKVNIHEQLSVLSDKENTIENDFILLGPKQAFKNAHSGVDFYLSDALPNWINTLITDHFSLFFDYYASKLPLHSNKKIIVAFEASNQPFYDGGVHGNTFVIRFGGEAYKKEDELAKQSIMSFIAHESFHLWSDRSKQQTSWLHEGAAEYAALIAQKHLSQLSQNQFTKEVAIRTSRCLLEHGSKVIPSRYDWPGRYDCGVAFIDSLINEDNFFSYWKKQQESPLESDMAFLQTYIPEKQQLALQRLTNPSTKPLDILTSFSQLIKPIPLMQQQDDTQLRTLIFRHFMSSNCAGLISFNRWENLIQVYPQKTCHPDVHQLTGVITKLNNLDMHQDATALFISYLNSCHENGLVLLEGKSFSVKSRCSVPKLIRDKFTLPTQKSPTG